jgi:S-adenosylmethionine hydrolase
VSAPVVTFLSDYGYRDEFVGVCHGVIAARCPQARIIDLTHGIDLGDIRAGALVLRAALPYMPLGIHLAVVDPGVGGDRRAVVLRTPEGPRFLVGPDNGLLLAGASLFGGAAAAYDIGNSPERLASDSRTFDGRDVFAPVAGALAAGVGPAELGEAIDPAGLVELELPAARIDGDLAFVPVLSIDGYGNVALADLDLDLGPAEALVVETAGEQLSIPRGTRFGDVAPGQLVAYIDSRGALALAVNGGSAAKRLGLGVDDVVAVRLR